MMEPTRKDALDAAKVFLTALNVVLYHGEKGHVDNHLIAQHASSVRASMICNTMAAEMGVDFASIERVAMHVTKEWLEEEDSQNSAEFMERLAQFLKNSDSMKN